MKRVGILYHPKVPDALSLAQDIGRNIAAQGISPWVSSAWEEEAARREVAGTSLVLSLGGDGTILRAARIVIPHRIPILGINLGRLGFLAELEPAEALDKLPSLLAGEGWIEKRMMLKVEVIRANGGEEKSVALHALNEAVVGRGALPRAIFIDATIDGQFLTTYLADGVIAATPTGSTGYSLAAKGPILHPQAENILLVPISPHLSLDFPLMLPPTAVMEFKVRANYQASLSVDGQIDVPLKNGDGVRVERSPHMAHFLRSHERVNFYSTLKQRLKHRE